MLISRWWTLSAFSDKGNRGEVHRRTTDPVDNRAPGSSHNATLSTTRRPEIEESGIEKPPVLELEGILLKSNQQDKISGCPQRTNG